MRKFIALCVFAFVGICRAEEGKATLELYPAFYEEVARKVKELKDKPADTNPAPVLAVSSVPVVAAERWIKSESDAETVWIDKMTDGTYRESAVAKQPTVIRTRLVATNDVGFAWRFDYESKLSDGSVVTNASFRTKPPKALLNEKLADMGHAQPEIPDTNETDVATEMTQAADMIKAPAAAAMAQAIVVRRRSLNTRPISFEQDGKGHGIATFADGHKETRDIQRVVSARIPSPYAKEIQPPPGNKYGAKELAAFAAGVAATLAALGVKKAV